MGTTKHDEATLKIDDVRSLAKRRWRVDGGLVVAAIIVGIFLWAVFYIVEKTSY